LCNAFVAYLAQYERDCPHQFRQLSHAIHDELSNARKGKRPSLRGAVHALRNRPRSAAFDEPVEELEATLDGLVRLLLASIALGNH
jgi:hypothetical protein